MFDRVVNQLSAAAATTSTTGASTTSAQAAAALMRFGGIGTARDQDKSTEEPIRDEDGMLNIDVAEKMLKWHAEAVGRCVELSPTNDLLVLSLFLTLFV
jgi:exocyst complex component 5